jgi:hypothetical protein
MKRAVGIEAGDELRHVAKFKSFTVEVLMTFKAMNGPGLGSSNGSRFTTGGSGLDAIYVSSPDGGQNGKVVPDRFRRGSVPVWFNVTPEKVSLRYAREVLTAATNRPNDVHQLVLRGGPDGCAFSQLVINGVPDPAWLKEVEAE